MDNSEIQQLLFTEIKELRTLVVAGQKDTSERLATLESVLVPSAGHSVLDDHEDRLRSIEKFRYWVAGIVASASMAWEYFIHRKA